MHASKQTWSRGPAVFQTKCQNGEELSDFVRGMIVGARQGGLCISETADLLRFSHTTVSRMVGKTKNIQGAAVLQAIKCLVNERSRRRRARVVITTHYSGMQKSIAEHTRHQTSEDQ